MNNLPGTVAVLGAGFSIPAGLPSTDDLARRFLALSETFPTPHEIQASITRHLRRFWEDVFGYRKGRSPPSFEDHFTALDLAANTGHNLGHYTPAKLRALRRLSIHRIFDVLDTEYRPNPLLGRFLGSLGLSEGAAVVSLNWDVVVENHLEDAEIRYSYAVPGRYIFDEPPPDAFPLIKLHGSANWHYCDSCRTVQFGDHGKTALVFRTFLEAKDFAALGDEELAPVVGDAGLGGTPCLTCRNRKTTARVATFSYSKAFDYFLFQASWDAALQRLRQARQWLFIGYSLPEADFAFRHLLKTAELASLGEGPKDIRVVSRDPTGLAMVRYQRFFGERLIEFANDGVESWIESHIQ